MTNVVVSPFWNVNVAPDQNDTNVLTGETDCVLKISPVDVVVVFMNINIDAQRGLEESRHYKYEKGVQLVAAVYSINLSSFKDGQATFSAASLLDIQEQNHRFRHSSSLMISSISNKTEN